PATTASNVNVQLSILPWGEVFINGVSRGVSPPVKILSLKPGQYRVKVVNGDLPPYQQQLTVQAGKPTAISHSFE
ncbi:PEGA domain-containing protein, partial [Pollutimonas bauzanensis]|uniref:PEGA domain-containing protein n=1 Tax=Pollutimonas bauzanensis TaxID=658167 RepID=UPI0033425F55